MEFGLRRLFRQVKQDGHAKLGGHLGLGKLDARRWLAHTRLPLAIVAVPNGWVAWGGVLPSAVQESKTETRTQKPFNNNIHSIQNNCLLGTLELCKTSWNSLLCLAPPQALQKARREADRNIFLCILASILSFMFALVEYLTKFATVG